MSIEDTLSAMAAFAAPDPFPWQVPAKPLAYLDVLEGRFNVYFQAIWRLDIPELSFDSMTTRDARKAHGEVGRAIAACSGAFYEAVSKGNALVALDEAAHLPAGLVRSLLVTVNAVAWASYQAHDSGAWEWAVANGKASASDMQDSAETIYRLWGGVAKLYDLGVLNALKKPQFKGTSGLGADPVSTSIGTYIVIAIAVTAALAIIAWLILALVVESNRVALIEKTCLDPKTGQVLKDPPPHCPKYFDNIAKDPNAHLATFLAPFTEALSSAVRTAVVIAGIGVLGYVAVAYVLPALASRPRREPAPAEA